MFFLKKKGIKAVVVAVCFVLLFYFITHFIGANPVSKTIKSVFLPFTRGVSYVSYKVSSFRDFLWEMDAYKKQNDELIKRVNELELQNKSTEQYRNENEKLHRLLELQDSMTEYTSLAAKVVAYSANNWYDTLEIDKGALNGISVGNCVITDAGVVGSVIEVGPNWATVSSVINPDSAIGIRLSRTDSLGLVEGDAAVFGNGLCKLSFLDRNSNVIVGDLLETSGSGGIYPPGLLVGKVKDISSDNTGNLDFATVEPAVDFSKLYAVLVINGMEE